jgi:RNA polymerase sigma-70 factor (ECF subfamily)
MPGTSFNLADDGDLVAAIGRRDARAMDEVVRRHRTAVRAFARRLVGDDTRAEDVSQDVFVRLWEHWDRYDASRGALRAFLLALTHGRSLDLVRSDTARIRREQREARHETSRAVDPAAHAAATEVTDIVRAALATLQPDERRALELAYYDGHSYRAVAAMLGEPEGTVKARIRRALAKLRGALADQELSG